ncbi:MAG: beta-lactamase family protein, partial [Alphaproteobacteria bacterium]|nr:beta-lactamase family protein [Alphaproteobacteria bacterium]
RPPGAALAISKDGRLVYARGFGYADMERRQPVQPTALFRIASLSKSFTATAVLQLMQQKKLRADDRVFDILKVRPFLEPGARLDPRIHDVTVRHCLQHLGGWDRQKSFDPTGSSELVGRKLGVRLPIRARDIITYTFGRPLDFDPGARFAYSNFGYCVLGRVIETSAGVPYGDYVARNVLAPIGITRMRLGRNLLADRAPGEVKYYDARKRTGRAVSGPDIGNQVPLPYGVEHLEAGDANGGWIASPIMLTRFLDSFNDIRASKLLDEPHIRFLYTRPPGEAGLANGKPRNDYYGCGFAIRVVDAAAGRFTRSHGGLLAGSNAWMLGRHDGVNWAVLFNSNGTADGKEYIGLVDAPMHRLANQMKSWPTGDLYPKYAI